MANIDGMDKALENKAETLALDGKANIDGSGLGAENIIKWKEALGMKKLAEKSELNEEKSRIDALENGLTDLVKIPELDLSAEQFEAFYNKKYALSGRENSIEPMVYFFNDQAEAPGWVASFKDFVDFVVGKSQNTENQPKITAEENFVEYNLTPVHPSITVGSGGCKVLINKAVGMGMIMLDFTSTEHITSNTTLFELPDGCPLPKITLEKELPKPIYYYSSAKKVMVPPFDIEYTVNQFVKTIYCIKGNKAIRGKVLPNHRYRVDFSLFFN